MKKLSLMEVFRNNDDDFDMDADEYEAAEMRTKPNKTFADIEKELMNKRINALKNAARFEKPKIKTTEEKLANLKRKYLDQGGYTGKYANQYIQMIRKYEPDFELEKENDERWSF